MGMVGNGPVHHGAMGNVHGTGGGGGGTGGLGGGGVRRDSKEGREMELVMAGYTASIGGTGGGGIGGLSNPQLSSLLSNPMIPSHHGMHINNNINNNINNKEMQQSKPTSGHAR